MCDTKRLKDFRVFDGQFDNFFDFLDLLVESSDHVIGRIWHFLNLHQRDERVNLGGQDSMQDVVIGSDCYSEVGFDVCYFD